MGHSNRMVQESYRTTNEADLQNTLEIRVHNSSKITVFSYVVDVNEEDNIKKYIRLL